MDSENQEPAYQEAQEPEVNLSKWRNRFKASEAYMKDDFFYRYTIARQRLRSELNVINRNTKKMSHDNVNLVYSIGTSFVNSVYFKSPDINLTARDLPSTEAVENTEIKVNDIIQDQKVKKTVKRSIWDAFSAGFGCVYVDYLYEDEPAFYTQDPMTGEMVPSIERNVLKNEISIQRIRPDMLRFPRGFDFDNYQDSQWIGFDMIMDLETAKLNETWDESVREQLEGSKYEKLSSITDSKNSTAGQSEDLYVKIHFCFEKVLGTNKFKILVFADGIEEPLLYEDYSKGHVGFPLKFIYFNPLDDDNFYPLGDPWIWESQLYATDMWWRSYKKHVDSNYPKRIYNSAKLTPQEVTKLKQNNDLSWVGVNNQFGMPIENLISIIAAPDMPASIDNFFMTARNLLSELAPRTNISRGAEQPEKKTATQAKIEATGESIDIDARLDDVKEFIKDIVLDIAGILSQINSTMNVPMTDPQTKQIMAIKRVGAEGFTSKVNVDIDVETMQSKNKDVFRRQLIDAIGMLANLEPIANKSGETINYKFYLDQLNDVMGIRNAKDNTFIPLPAPMPVPVGGDVPGGQPPMSMSEGQMPPEAIEAGLAQRS